MTEKFGVSEEIYQDFVGAGFYRVLTPRKFSGFELAQEDFYELTMEIGRGCPDTAWWYALGAGHVVQLSSYYGEDVQREIFSQAPDFSAPWSANPQTVTAKRVEGGYRISGKWRFCSGVPHAPYFMGNIPNGVIPEFSSGTASGDFESIEQPLASILVPKGDFRILDDWGDLLGMNGSGSNSVELIDAFVPDRMIAVYDVMPPHHGGTAGSALHGNSLYGGRSPGFVTGSLAAIAVGVGLAALDELIDFSARRPNKYEGDVLHSVTEPFQRVLGRSASQVEAARGIVRHGARLYGRYAREAVTNGIAFDATRIHEICCVYKLAEEMVWNAVREMVGATSTGSLRNGQRMQLYFRDIATLVTRAQDLDYRSVRLGRCMLASRELPIERIRKPNDYSVA
ncbi:hypothetical protein [Mesorhizobium sp. Cs1299R1N3]|uniref:hypothetical protein n=1 Tax=Mesorhizobium sp. Cs1299R1N3 TaxID=3015173 RepID=UPI00301E0DC0